MEAIVSKIIPILLGVMLSSCVSLYPRQQGFNGLAMVTTYSKDTTCLQQHVYTQWSSNTFGVRVPFTYVSPSDTIGLDLFRIDRNTVQGIDTRGRRYEVTFPSGVERRSGVIVSFRTDDKIIVVGGRCFN